MNSNIRALIAIIFVNFVTISGFGFMFPILAVYGKAIDANATEIAFCVASFSLGQPYCIRAAPFACIAAFLIACIR